MLAGVAGGMAERIAPARAKHAKCFGEQARLIFHIHRDVLAPDDVGALIDHGVDGVILSNHGGRQLDGTVTALEMLPAAVEAAQGRIPILIDGGVRRGSDIIKAMALGAATVMVGRAALYGIGAGGEPGARRALEILFQEMDRTLALLGCPDVAGLGSEYVHLPIGFGGLR